MIGMETGICYTYNMIGSEHHFGDKVSESDLDRVQNGGEYNALELVLSVGGN